MKKFLLNLRQKTIEEKKQIASTWAGITTLVIALVYIIALNVFGKTSEVENVDSKKSKKTETISNMFNTIENSFSEVQSSLKKDKQNLDHNIDVLEQEILKEANTKKDLLTQESESIKNN